MSVLTRSLTAGGAVVAAAAAFAAGQLGATAASATTRSSSPAAATASAPTASAPTASAPTASAPTASAAVSPARSAYREITFAEEHADRSGTQYVVIKKVSVSHGVITLTADPAAFYTTAEVRKAFAPEGLKIGGQGGGVVFDNDHRTIALTLDRRARIDLGVGTRPYTHHRRVTSAAFVKLITSGATDGYVRIAGSRVTAFKGDGPGIG